MARTDADAIGGIIKVKAGDDLTPFIDVANMLVNIVCVPTGYDETEDLEQLTLIETWLAAHFYSIYKPRRLIEQVDQIRQQIESKVDIGLNVTRHGQMAMRIDTNGGLAALDNTNSGGAGGGNPVVPRRGIVWLGTEREE